MRAIAILSISFFLLPNLSAQNPTLADLLDQLREEMISVTTQKYRYEQSLTYEADRPWAVEIEVGEYSLKNDRGETMTFNFNLSDLEPNLVDYEDDRDELTVVLKTSKRQQLLKAVGEDGKSEYEAEVTLWSSNIEHARRVVELLQKVIPMADTAWQKSFQPGETIEDLNTWLSGQAFKSSAATANWKPSPTMMDQVEVTVSGPEDEGVTYSLSLADIDQRKLTLEIRRGLVAVEAGTVDRVNLISVKEDGLTVDYVDVINIPVGSIDEGRRLIGALNEALPLAREIKAARMLAPLNLEEGLQVFSKLLTEVKRDEEILKVSMSATPLSILEIREEGKTVRQLFDIGDLDSKSVALRVKGNRLEMMIRTKGGEDYIQRWEDDEADGFEDKLYLPVGSVETAHKLEGLLPYLIKEAAKLPAAVGDDEWLREATKEGSLEDVQQFLENEDGECKWQLTLSEEGKNAKEIVFEFNMEDLNANKVAYETDGKGVRVVAPTRGNEKIIKVFEDGEPEFTDEVIIHFSSLAAAKQASATLKALVKGCREK